MRLHGPAEHKAPRIVGRKVGVTPFAVDGIDHGLVAAVLGYEHGVGVRHGCFCAQSYIHHLLGVGDVESTRWLDRAHVDEHRGAPGMVRISLGAYNDMADIDGAVRALEWLAAREVQGRYRADPDGSFVPDGYVEPLLFDLGLPGSATEDLAPPSSMADHHVLELGVVLDGVERHVLAVAALLEPAVGHLRHQGDVVVDPDGAELQRP